MDDLLRDAIEAAHKAQRALHRLYESDTSDQAVWTAFLGQVTITRTLREVQIREDQKDAARARFEYDHDI